jgi:HTH-type transcriptional regulator, competence development regulator
MSARMDQAFGPALRDRRRSAGLSQRELAARTGLDFSYISKVENGRLPPPAADTIVALSRVLAISPEDLLALTGKIPSDVRQTVSSSRAAQQFLREAQQMALTDQEWAQMIEALRRLRRDP